MKAATHKLDIKNSKYVGKYIKRVDNLKKVTGKEQYGIDGGIKNALSAVIIPFHIVNSKPMPNMRVSSSTNIDATSNLC